LALKWQGVALVAGIAVLAAVIASLAFPPYISIKTPIHETYMLFALYGYMFLALTTLTLPFLKELVHAFGKPFLTIHHSFAVLGIIFITLHPILNAVESFDPTVFVPDFSSWKVFWYFAGRPAFIILYASLLAALLRKKAIQHWKPFHLLIYVTLTFGIVHANLLGSSFFDNFAITAIYDGLYAASIGAFMLKRYQNYQLKKKKQANNQINHKNSNMNNPSSSPNNSTPLFSKV